MKLVSVQILLRQTLVGDKSKNLPCTPGEENIMVLLATSASEGKVPPPIIFKGKNIWGQWHAPESTGYPETTCAPTTNCWIFKLL